MIEIYLLEQLDAFARCGTLTGAAQALHITQPALTRAMKKLEAELGVPLFDRTKGRLALNETGQVAAQQAGVVLAADREFVERTLAFARSRRTLVLGACASLPINLLMPVLQEQFGGMAITTEVTDDDRLLTGLQDRVYQLAVLHAPPEGPGLFYQRYIDEQLCVDLLWDHPLAGRESVSFAELDGMSLLAHSTARFWMAICRAKLPHSRLLAQETLDSLQELVVASNLPVFSSDRIAVRSPRAEGRVRIPIRDAEARATYYLACLEEEKRRFAPVFSAVRAAAIRGK